MSMLQTTIRPRRSSRRGIILVFVVVLLVLLAIMGTAYLASTRADLVAIRGRGAGPNANAPLLVDTTNLDSAYDTVDSHLRLQVGVADLLGEAPATASAEDFRQGGTYENYDAPGAADLWLASTLPFEDTTSGNVIRWRWMSAAIAAPSNTGTPGLGADFADPRAASGAGVGSIGAALRENALISNVPMQATTRVKTNRVYPGFEDASGNRAIGGDADGDGIADSFLIPIVINPALAANANPLDEYVDEQNGVIYYYCYRVVDNNSMINIGTALSVKGDFPLYLLPGDNSAANDADPRSDFGDETRGMVVQNNPPSTPAPNYAPEFGAFSGANYGFFRSNVGLIELIQESLAAYTGQSGSAAVNSPLQAEVRRLIDLRVPGLNEDPTVAQDDDTFQMKYRTSGGTYDNALYLPDGTFSASSSTFTPYFFRSLGDLIEQQALKRPGDPQPYDVGTLNFLASPPGVSNLASLHEKGGALLNSRLASSNVEGALSLTLRATTPNFNGRPESMWKWFPANKVRLWYEWTKNLDGFRRDPSSPLHQPVFRFDPNVAPFNLASGEDYAGMTAVDLQRSLRSILTTYNGVGSATPVRADPGNVVPTGMPEYPTGAVADLNAPKFGEYPASKVSAATGTKRQLWRAYWSAMTTNTNAGAWQAEPGIPFVVSAARYTGSDDTISGRNMARLRSAIAAVNTIDLRDADEDITVLDVEMEGQTAPSGGPVVTLRAQVYGTERRPYITEVFWADADGIGTDPANGPYLAVKIYNPHDQPIDLSNYYLGVVARSGNSLSNGTITATSAPMTQLNAAFVGSAPVLQPGMFAVIATGTPPAPHVPPGPVYTGGFPAPSPVTNPLQFHVTTLDPQFATLASGNELVLARRRRADNVSTTYPAPNGALSELPDASPLALLRMVPIETIDMRQVVPVGGEPTQFQYRRFAVDLTLNTPEIVRDRWKCVYGGQFFTIDMSNTPITDDPTVRPSTPSSIPAWKKYASVSTTDPTPATGADAGYTDYPHNLGGYETSVVSPPVPPVSENNRPFASPPIQIQNFRTNLLAHPADRFPFGSPFARDADILNVPFIGAYQIYRLSGATYTLFEQNALPMDAFLAEPDPVFAATNASLGRMDPVQLNTTWAIDLFDYVTARQAPAHDFYPDVPRVELLGGGTADVSNVATDELAYVGGDGPVSNPGDAPNASTNVVWTKTDVPAPQRRGQKLAEGSTTNIDQVDVIEALSLIQGKININTAPPVVLRTLPLTVDPNDGQLNVGELDELDDIVDQIETQRDATGPFVSLLDIVDRVPRLAGDPNILPAITITSPQLINIGDLSGLINKPGDDLQRRTFNLNRVSNVLTTRSDVYTVYFSVQAWTYRPGVPGWNQATDTRLIGERRSAFVLDRSQVSPATSLTVGSLRIFPIINE